MPRILGLFWGVVLASPLLGGCELHTRTYYGGYGEPANSPGAPQAAPGPTAAVAVAPDPEWVGELPDAATVKATVRGSTDEETVALQDAALAVMQVYASARAGKSIAIVGATEGVPPLAAQRHEEYQRAQTPPRSVFDKRLSPTAEAYFLNTRFHLALLSRLVSPASVAAYQSSPEFQGLAQDQDAREGQAAFEKGIEMLMTAPAGGGAVSSGGNGTAQAGGSAPGQDIGASCRAGCNRSCPGAWGSGEQWAQSQAAYDRCLNEIQTCKIGCPP